MWRNKVQGFLGSASSYIFIMCAKEYQALQAISPQDTSQKVCRGLHYFQQGTKSWSFVMGLRLRMYFPAELLNKYPSAEVPSSFTCKMWLILSDRKKKTNPQNNKEGKELNLKIKKCAKRCMWVSADVYYRITDLAQISPFADKRITISSLVSPIRKLGTFSFQTSCYKMEKSGCLFKQPNSQYMWNMGYYNSWGECKLYFYSSAHGKNDVVIHLFFIISDAEITSWIPFVLTCN